MTARPQHDTHGFFLGLMTGGIVGAGVAILLAPRLAAELRQRVAGSATATGDAATSRYQEVSAHIPAMMDTTSAEAVRDDVADAVGRGGRQVEQFAIASKRRKRSQP